MRYLLLIIFILSVCFAKSQTYTLTVEVSNLRDSKGNLAYALYTSEPNYEKSDALVGGFVDAKEGKLSFNIDGLSKAYYALAIFHDENKDKKINFNFFGVPKEGFGYSNNPKIRFSEPKFDEIKLHVTSNRKITIDLNYFL
jgi:uncharacterized protein (DUF2141 family)